MGRSATTSHLTVASPEATRGTDRGSASASIQTRPLTDHSINGSYVMLDGEEEVHVLRGELPLTRSGRLSAGRSLREDATEVVSFQYDRRSMFRI